MSVIRPATIIVLSALCCHASAQWFGWLDENLLKRIKVTGSRTIGLHVHEVEGDRETFDNLTYYGQGSRRVTDTGSVTLSGKQVLGAIDFDVTLSDNRFGDPLSRRILLNYKRGPLAIQAGDIQGSLLNTNPFAQVGRAMKGASVEYRSGGFAAKVLRTEAKGSARTITLQGNNSQGPYYLQSSQIIPDSEEIQLDGKPMVLGSDYVIDYELGAITFVGRTPSPTSTIVASYETLGFNASLGVVQGASLSQNFGRLGQIGLTLIEQRARGGGALSQRAERFQGFGAPSTPYFLEFEPLRTYPFTVRVDGLLQTEGVDFVFDSVNPAIFYFRRFMPSTSTVEVVYTPKPVGTVDGDRRVLGFDYRLPLGGSNYLKYSQATGSLSSPVNPLSGTARGVNGYFELGGVKLRTGWKDVPNSFVSVETRSFSRNERAFDLSAEYSAGGLNYEASHKNSSIGVRRVSADGSFAFDPVRTTSTLAKVGANGWSAEVSRNTAAGSIGSTKLDQIALSHSRRLGPVNARFGADVQSGRISFLDGGQLVDRNLGLHSLRADFDYKPGKAWSLNARTAFSNVTVGGERGSGRDLTLSASYRPDHKLDVEMSYVDSDSGALATLNGFQSGFGIGYGGNGFSGGASSFGVGGGQSLRVLSAKSRYRVSPSLGFEGRASRTRSEGAISANTETTAFSAGVDWMFGRHGLNLSIDQTRTSFIDSPITSDALSISADLSGRPGPRWSYSLGASYLVNGGASLFRQNNFAYGLDIRYALSSRQNLSFRYQQGTTRGYLPQADFMAGLFYEHQLYRNVSLISSYKIRRLSNLDPLNPGGAYRSQGFDLELSFNFGS